jgi:hypothetical protein
MSTTKHRILAFDIGIKNLAYCLLEKSSAAETIPKIIAWENVNILNDGEGATAAAKPKCQRCNKNASYGILKMTDGVASASDYYCARHIPATAPILTDSNGTAFTKIPAVAELKDVCARRKLERPTGSKGQGKREDWLTVLSEKCSLPLKVFAKKKVATMHVGLAALHDGILAMIFDDNRYDLLLSANQVLLENQPVLKNPTMKSVQVLLFASLRDAFKAEHGSAPPFHLVHAGKKVRGAAAGDAGYAARKEGGEARVKEWLEKNCAGSAWDKKFTGAAKKSDLADALCMCLDATVPAAN